MIKSTSELIMIMVCGVTTSGTSAVGLAGVMGTGETNAVLNQDTLIPFGLFLAGLAMTATVIWKVASHKAGTEVTMREIIKRLDRLEKTLYQIQSRKKD